MILKCKAKCTEIHKKSQSPAFKNLIVGDVIEFSTEIAHNNRSWSGSATYIDCYNPRTDEHSDLSFNQLSNILKSFEFEEIDDLADIADSVEDKMTYMCGCQNCIKTVTQIIKGDVKPFKSQCKECGKYEDCKDKWEKI